MEKIRIRDGKNSDPGSRMEKIRIRDKHLGSATLVSFTSFSKPQVFSIRNYLIRIQILLFPGPSGSGSYPLNQANKMRYLNWQIFYVHNGTAARLFHYSIYRFSKEMTVPMYVNKNELGHLQNLNKKLHIFFCQKVRFPDLVQLFRIRIRPGQKCRIRIHNTAIHAVKVTLRCVFLTYYGSYFRYAKSLERLNI
jgi:hypothetical protein